MIQSKLERGLAGLQAGMFGGIALLATMLLVSFLDRRYWASYPNLLAAHFYGPRTIAGGFGWPTLSGLALQLLIAGIAGAVFGALFGSLGGSRRRLLLGLAWGVVVFWASEQFYRFSSPIVLAYLPQSALLVAHMIYGVSLAGIGWIGSPEAGNIAGSAGPSIAPPENDAAPSLRGPGESSPPQNPEVAPQNRPGSDVSVGRSAGDDDQSHA